MSDLVRAPRRAAVAFVLITVFLDVVAMGIVIPVFPGLIVDFVKGDTARGAVIFGLFGTAWALMQFLFSPAMGVLSDRLGRRPVILLSNIGLGLDYVLMALAPTLAWLFIGRIIAGITAASMSAATAYIADVMPPDKRAGAFGLIGAAFGLGFILGPAMGGILGDIDPRLPFWVAAGFSLANATYGIFVLPESLPRERRRSFGWQRANPIGSLKLFGSHPELARLSAVHFINTLAHNAMPSIFVLYAGYRYGWDERIVGLTMAAYGVATVIIQGFIVNRVVRKFGERAALIAGLLCGATGFLIYGFAPTGNLFWAGLPVAAFWGLCGPASQGLMSRYVDPNNQGQLQGGLSSMFGITGLIGPGMFTLTFSYFIGSERPFEAPGAPMMVAAILLFFATFLAWRLSQPGPQENPPSSP